MIGTVEPPTVNSLKRALAREKYGGSLHKKLQTLTPKNRE